MSYYLNFCFHSKLVSLSDFKYVVAYSGNATPCDLALSRLSKDIQSRLKFSKVDSHQSSLHNICTQCKWQSCGQHAGCSNSSCKKGQGRMEELTQGWSRTWWNAVSEKQLLSGLYNSLLHLLPSNSWSQATTLWVALTAEQQQEVLCYHPCNCIHA